MAPGHRAGSSTRLLILGCVRIFQPVHGYFIRRELLSWRVDDWASVHPGSIYHALRALADQGLLDEVRTDADGARPPRTSYRLTSEGEAMYGVLLRDSLSDPDDPIAFTEQIENLRRFFGQAHYARRVRHAAIVGDAGPRPCATLVSGAV